LYRGRCSTRPVVPAGKDMDSLLYATSLFMYLGWGGERGAGVCVCGGGGLKVTHCKAVQ
jgi:hypothetical protein